MRLGAGRGILSRMHPISLSQKIGIALAALAASVLIGYVFWQGAHKPGFRSDGADTQATTTTTQVSPSAMVVTTPEGNSYTITQVPIDNAPKAPTYRDAIACPASLSTTGCAAVQAKRVAIIAALDVGPTDAEAWLALGTLRKSVGDYQGAVVVWRYMTALYPSDATAFYDLADLYAHFLNDYAKAEANYLKAVSLAPSNTGTYQDLFTLYTTTSYKPSTSAAENILKQGMAANPTAFDLQVMLARYYRSLGRIEDANTQYAAAAANATAQGKTSLAAQITAEASR